MERRPYFVAGDLIANVTVGALVGLVCAALFGGSSSMWLSMLTGMTLGMMLGLGLSVGIFVPLFGVMEVVIPAMLTGMVAGMAIGMTAPMTAISHWAGVLWGGLVGVVCMLATYVANSLLVGRTTSW